MLAQPAFAAIVLAAGGSRRLGQAKQLVALDGEPLVRRAVRAAIASGATLTHVVTGAHGDAVYDAVRDLPVLRVACARWQRGLSATLRAGVHALEPLAAVDGALVLLCDQPALAAGHLRAVAACWRARRGAVPVATRYAEVVGVPALFPRSWFAALAALAGDVGARELLRGADAAGAIETVAAPAYAADVDTPADLAGLGRERGG